MARNVEIKARVTDLEALARKVAVVASEGPVEIQQDDTFFRCEAGRLKLRDFGNGSGELIFYQRSDQAGPRESFYIRSSTSSPDELRRTLSLAYGETGRVLKQRTLFLVGRTRVHLDCVAGLGSFMELEVVLREEDSIESGVEEAHRLMKSFDIQPHDLVERPYVELLRGSASNSSMESRRSASAAQFER